MREELTFKTIVTGYGLTETTGIATMCRHDDDAVTISTTSGRAIPGVEVRIVDDEPAPALTVPAGRCLQADADAVQHHGALDRRLCACVRGSEMITELYVPRAALTDFGPGRFVVRHELRLPAGPRRGDQPVDQQRLRYERAAGTALAAERRDRGIGAGS